MVHVKSSQFLCNLHKYVWKAKLILLHMLEHVLSFVRYRSHIYFLNIACHFSISIGGMFTYVSGANFFGEIVEWSGFALACWSLPGLAFAIFTALNIGPRAIQHHRYSKTFFV